MLRKRCFRCSVKAKKAQLHNLKEYNRGLEGYVCHTCFEVIDVQLNLTGDHPETPPQ